MQCKIVLLVIWWRVVAEYVKIYLLLLVEIDVFSVSVDNIGPNVRVVLPY